MSIFKFLAFVLLFTSLEAGNCWRIQDRDQKALCESKYENQKFCWKIKDKDLQAYWKRLSIGKNLVGKLKTMI